MPMCPPTTTCADSDSNLKKSSQAPPGHMRRRGLPQGPVAIAPINTSFTYSSTRRIESEACFDVSASMLCLSWHSAFCVHDCHNHHCLGSCFDLGNTQPRSGKYCC